MVRCVQRRCFAGAILALVFVSLAAQNTKAQGSANSVQCGNQEASQLLQRGHDMFPKSGYGLPPVVASAGRALTYFELAAEKDRSQRSLESPPLRSISSRDGAPGTGR